jgi:hypothetical protein
MATSQEVIQTAYLQALGRPADPEGLSFYASQLESGRSLGEILKDLNYAASTGVEDVARNQQITAAGGWDFGPTTTPVTKPTTAPSGGITRDQAARIAAETAPRGGYTQEQINAWANWATTNPDVLQSANPEQQLRNSILAAQQAAGEASLQKPVVIPQSELANRDKLVGLYQSVLNRTPSELELSTYLTKLGKPLPGQKDPYTFSDLERDFRAGAQLEIGQKNRQEFVRNIQPYQSLAAGFSPLESLYREVLGRNIDPEGRAFYEPMLARGATIGEISRQMRLSPEYQNRPATFQREAVAPPQLGISGLPTGFQFMRAPPPAPVLNAPVSYLPFGAQDVAPVEAAPVEAAPVGAAPVGMAEGGMPRLSAKDVGSRFDVSEYIDPKTGRFYINEFQRDVVFNPRLREAERVERERMQGMAKGGLASIAENLADKGRGGDSMLVHMSPEEVQGLRGLAMQMGGDLSVNPQTGLPEAKWLKKLLPILPFIPGIGQILGPIAAGLGSFGTALSSFASASPILAKSIASGIIGGFTAPGKGFNFKEGLKTGATAFASAKALEGLQALNAANAASGAGAGASTPQIDPFAFGSPEMYGSAIPTETGAQLMPSPTVPTASTTDYSNILAKEAPTQGITPKLPEIPSNVGSTSEFSLTDAPVRPDYSLSTPPTTTTTSPTAGGRTILGMTPGEISLGVTGLGAVSAANESKKAAAAQAAKDREEEERRRRYRELFEQTLGRVPMAAGGGMVAFADGGMPTFEYGGTTAPTGEPRMVKGAGDGMSDNVPANIEGVQEARLANDEFVVPADVVADIGNGSSSAGAKKLYAMMDRIRKARHGTTEQPPEIDAERLMPA